MVTTQGFNALLKLVEEPPPHLRFIFATTEPDKVLPTIRSRTHHYPFRLIPPRLLSSYLSELCEKEGVTIEAAALPLVVRAGAGSARDTLSVLDQLLGGAGPEGVTYDLATGLLGYTPDTLLDDVVDAFAAGDGAAVFGVVDKVIETGQDPRRFTEDLLRRLRDLVIVAAVPDAPATGLIDVSEDQGERLVAQAARFGPAELSRAADIVATGLTEMRGATAPRLLLELLCARVLLPGADHATDGVLARLDRLEKRLTISGTPSAVIATPAAPAQDRFTAPSRRPAARSRRGAPGAGAPARDPPGLPGSPGVGVTEPVAATPTPEPVPRAARDAGRARSGGADPGAPGRRRARRPGRADPGRRTPAVARHRRRHQAPAPAGLDAPDPELPGRRGRRATLTLGFANAGARDSFVSGGCDDVLRQAAIDVVGADWKIETIVDPGAQADGPVVTKAAVPATPEPSGETSSRRPLRRPPPLRGPPTRPATAPPTRPVPRPRPSPRPRPGAPPTRSRSRRPAARSSRPGRATSRAPTTSPTGRGPTPTPTPTTSTRTSRGSARPSCSSASSAPR